MLRSEPKALAARLGINSTDLECLDMLCWAPPSHERKARATTFPLTGSAHRARLILQLDSRGPTEEEFRERLIKGGLRIARTRVRLRPDDDRRAIMFDIRYLRNAGQSQVPPAIKALADEAGIVSLEWRPLS